MDRNIQHATKGLYISMTIFLQAYADKVGDNKLNVTLKVIKDLDKVTQKTILLPDKKSDFIRLTEDLYNSSEKPNYVTKKEFKKDFIDYTLGLDIFSIDPDILTVYYNELFDLTKSEAYEAIAAQQQEQIEEIKQSLAKIQENNIEKYNDLKEQTTAQAYINDAEQRAIEPHARPTAAGERPVRNIEALTDIQGNQLANLPKGIGVKLKGVAGDKLWEGVPEPLLYPGDKELRGENNSGVIFGRDEIYRLKSHTQSGACYLYAGRSPNNIQTEKKDKDGNLILRKPNDLIRDSAYLYLSQKSNPDDLLRVAKGTYGKVVGGQQPRKGKSLAAIKADDVVLMARESGIRLITGTDRTNSRDGEMFSSFGIDLIAGNNDEDLQPLVKGENLITYLEGLSKAVDDLRKVVYSFITSQLSYNATIANHRHYDPFCIFLGLQATGNPLSVLEGKNFISPEVQSAGIKALLEGAQQQQSTITQMMNNVNNDLNGLTKIGAYRITSEKNRTN